MAVLYKLRPKIHPFLKVSLYGTIILIKHTNYSCCYQEISRIKIYLEHSKKLVARDAAALCNANKAIKQAGQTSDDAPLRPPKADPRQRQQPHRRRPGGVAVSNGTFVPRPVAIASLLSEGQEVTVPVTISGRCTLTAAPHRVLQRQNLKQKPQKPAL